MRVIFAERCIIIPMQTYYWQAEIGLEYILGNLSMILNTSGGTRSSSS